jgi:alpha-tubulin suppressor-like RCC1 family protein
VSAAFALSSLASLVGCRAPTQITVDVSTNVPCASWQGTAIAVGTLGPALEAKPATTTSTYCDSSGHLGSVVAVPSGGDNASVAFRVVGAVSQTLEACTGDAGAGCIVARRALNFIPHESLSLSVPLVSACEGVPCDPLSTCVDGQCRPATIANPGNCADQTCGEGALGPADGGTVGPTDGSVLDSTVGGDGALPDGALPDGEVPEASPSGDGGGLIDAAATACGAGCALAVGGKFTCALRGGNVSCWGQNYLGELGNGTMTSPGTPAHVIVAGGAPLAGVQGIVAGSDTSCAFLGGGALSCWGAGAPLLLGNDGNDPWAVTQPFLAGASTVAIGSFHLCWQHGAAVSCATVGQQEEGAFGIADAGPDADPDAGVVATIAPPPSSPGPFLQLKTSQYFTCVLDTNGNVYCIGDNSSNECDPSLASPSQTLTSFVHAILPGGVAAQEIAVLSQTACARAAGHVFCWGTGYHDASGGLPDGGQRDTNQIVYPDGGPITDAVLLAPGDSHACVLRANAQVACWGANDFHELGRGEPAASTGIDSTVADMVRLADGGTFGGVSFVASGGSHTCATTTDGNLWCWGENDNGESAPGDPAMSKSTPALVTY